MRIFYQNWIKRCWNPCTAIPFDKKLSKKRSTEAKNLFVLFLLPFLINFNPREHVAKGRMQFWISETESQYIKYTYIRTVSFLLLLCIWQLFPEAEIECTVGVALPKWPINSFKLDHQMRQHSLRAYCPNTVTSVFCSRIDIFNY